MAPKWEVAPTILDVAAIAKVSKSTVSNVIRGAPIVSATTRARVTGAIETLGYRPNVLARHLAEQRTRLIGVIAGSFKNPFFSEIAPPLERESNEAGYTALFCSQEGEGGEVRAVEMLLDHRVAGIVFLAFSGRPDGLATAFRRRTPVGFVGCHEAWGDSTAVDDVSAAETAVQHLIRLGHTSIAYLTTPAVEQSSDADRLEGCRHAIASAGLREPVVWQWQPDQQTAQIDGQPGSIAAVLQASTRPSAVFACNDLAAIALMTAADTLGVSIPRELSIVGFDNVSMSRLQRIGLTTVAQPVGELARLGIMALVDRIEGRRRGAPETFRVGFELIVRRSTSAPMGHVNHPGFGA